MMKATYKRLLFNVLLLSAAVLLIFGISTPMMTFEQFYIFENSVSLISALQDLKDNAEWLLFWVILIFSILFPIVKLLLLIRIVNHETHQHRKFWLHWLAVLGKWSMLDVFVVALLLVSLKMEMIANVVVQNGLYAFAGSVLLTMLITHTLHFAEGHDAKN